MALNDNLEFGSHFDNGTATDWSGNGNDGTVTGATATTDKNDVANQALLLDGANDYIDLIKFVWDSNDFTINIWYNLDSTWTGANPYIFRHEGGNFIGIVGPGTTARLLKWNIEGSSGSLNRTTTTLVGTDTWSMVTITRIGNVFKFYKDAVQIDTETIVLGSVNPTFNARIGATVTEAAEWKGKFDEPRVYYRGLSAAEVLEIYNLYDEEVTLTSKALFFAQDM